MVNPVIEELPILIAGIVNEEAIVPKVTRGFIKTPNNITHNQWGENWENPEPDRTEQRAIHASMTY